MKTRRSVALLIVVFALVSSACGDSGTTTTTPAEAVPSVATTTPPKTTAAPTTTAVPTTLPPTTTTVAPTTVPTGDTPAAGDEAALLAALANSSTVASGRMEGFLEITGIEGAPAGTELAMQFSGAFDNDAGTFAFIMDLSGIAAAAGEDIPPGFEDVFSEMEIRQISDTAYMRFPFFSTFLGVGTEWISFPAEESGAATEGLIAATPANPADFLAIFESVGASVTEVGPETIRGVDTVHYMVVFDVDELLQEADPEELTQLEGLGPLPIDEFPMDIWISEGGLVHRFEISFDGSMVDAPAGDGFERMVMRFDIFDHGAPVDIEAPPEDQVTDGTDLLGIFEQ